MKRITFFCFVSILLTSCDKEVTSPLKSKWYLFQNNHDTTRGMVMNSEYVYVAYQNNGLVEISKFNLSQRHFTPTNSGLSSIFTTCVDVDDLNQVWIGTDRGLSVFDGANWSTYDHTNSPLPDSPIQDLDCDDQGNIWIATFYGLYKKTATDWIQYDLSNGLSDTLLRKVKAIDQKIFVGSTVGGIDVLSDDTWQNFNLSNSQLQENQIRFFVPDVDGSLWIGSFWYFYHLSNNVWSVFNDQNTEISHPWVNDLAIEQNGTMHFATHNGYSIWEADGSWSTFLQETSPLPDNIVEMVEIDEQGNIWLGTFGGLAIYNQNGVTY